MIVPEIRIRGAVAADEPALAELDRTTWSPLHAVTPVPERGRPFFDGRHLPEHYLVAEITGITEITGVTEAAKAVKAVKAAGGAKAAEIAEVAEFGDGPELAKAADGPESAETAASGVVGYVRLGSPTPLAANAHVRQIQGLAVSGDARGRGVARALLRAAMARARAQGATRLTLRVLGHNTPARTLYEAEGFRVEGVLPGEFLLDGTYVDDVLMGRTLI
ncbi:GNAT family N-acetyltransferase [Streptomyces sp. NPDC101115]|uniref:GNAT family N-acetyltransferase n=1 Tax=Streptomyces sp. NPDC101115 TaxID=3366106 RepID=UPI003811EAED